MIIIAIDPGPVQSAVVIYDGQYTKPTAHAKLPNSEVLKRISDAPKLGVAHAVIEIVQSYGKPVGQHVFDTMFWAGRFTQAADWCGLPVMNIKNPTMRAHLCGQVSASYSHIRRVLIDRHGGDEALAVPVACKRKKHGAYGRFPDCGCGGTGVIGTHGILHDYRGVADDEWAALGLAVTFIEQRMPKIPHHP